MLLSPNNIATLIKFWLDSVHWGSLAVWLMTGVALKKDILK